MLEIAKSGTCEICAMEVMKYTCPKCEIGYCSLKCYKVHGDCTEVFYQGQVEETMQAMVMSQDNKDSVLEILKRDYEEKNIEMEEFELMERMGKLRLDDPGLIDRLSMEEKMEFFELLKSGDIKDVIPVWTPWWTTKEQKDEDLVTEMEYGDDLLELEEYYPTMISPMPELNITNPSDKLGYNLIEILYSYAYTMRLYNGDIIENIDAVSSCLYYLCTIACENKIFNSVNEVVQQVVIRSNHPTIFNTTTFSVLILDDIIELTTTEINVMLCLSDIHNYLTEFIEERKRTKSRRSEMKKMLLFQKKIEFYLSWFNNNPTSIIHIIPLLITETKRQKEYLNVRNSPMPDSKPKPDKISVINS